MNRKVADQWCERGILFLTLAILIFGPLATGAVRTLEFLVLQGLTVGVLGLWTARFWLDRRLELLWPPVCWAVAAFALYAVARYLTADIEYAARQELMRVLVYTFLFFAILNNLHGQESTRLITFTMIALAMVISSYAIYQFITKSDRVWHFVNPYKFRGSGTYINPNHLAGFLEMILPVSLAWTFASRAKPVAKILLGYASLVLLAGITVTMSRAAWASTGAVILVLLVVIALRSTYRWPALILLIVVAGVGFNLVSRSFYLKKRWEMVSKDLAEGRLSDNRPAIWQAAVQMWHENPWWGVGPDHFDQRFREYRPALVQNQPDRVHNDYLNTLTDWGIVGAALVAAAWALLAAGVFQTWHFVRGSLSDLGGRSSNKFALVFGTSLGLLAVLIHSAADFNMHIPANAILAVTWMALLTAHLRFATERYWFRPRVPAKILATVVLLTGMAYLGAQGWQRAHEYYWLDRAEAARQKTQCFYTPDEIAAREKAFAVEPRNFETACEIGEGWRKQSWAGGSDYGTLATNAMTWFQRCLQLNPYEAKAAVGLGMCLDWLGRPEEAQRHFDRATELDPNGYYTVAQVGWHYMQIQNYAAARPWFELSSRLKWPTNEIAANYLKIIDTRLLEAATNTSPIRLVSPPR